MQKMNRSKVLSYIRKHPGTSRPAISKATGLSLVTVNNLTAYLTEVGLVTEMGTEQVSRVGRKGAILRFEPSGYGFISVILDEEGIEVELTDLEGSVISELIRKRESRNDVNVTSAITEGIKDILGEAKDIRILAAGIFVSGMVLSKNRLLLSSSLRIKDPNIKEAVEKATGIPVFLENLSFIRARACMLSREKSGETDALPEDDDMIFVDMYKGIGAVHCYDDRIDRSFFGEIGHTTSCPEGEECFCGNRGCLEVMCSEERIKRLYCEYSGKCSVTGKELSLAAESGDENALRAVKECARYLGIAMADLVSLFYPSRMVISGEGYSCHGLLIDEAVKEMKSHAYSELTRELVIKRTELTKSDVISAAAFELCERVFDAASDISVI